MPLPGGAPRLTMRSPMAIGRHLISENSSGDALEARRKRDSNAEIRAKTGVFFPRDLRSAEHMSACVFALTAPLALPVSPVQSVAVAVPLALFQLGTQQLTGLPHVVDAPLLAADVALAYGIYGADRSAGGVPALAMTVSSAAASAWLLSDAATRPFAPMPIVLCQYYATLIKHRLDIAKPFFVGACWVALVYFIPLLRVHEYDVLRDWATPATLFLMISSTSQAADAFDIEEDIEAGLVTPAVAMGKQTALLYAVSLSMAASVVGTTAPTAVGELANVLLAASTVYVCDFRIAILAVVSITGALVRYHEYEIARSLLETSQVFHSWSINLLLLLTDIETPLPWPPSVLRVIRDTALGSMEAGDAMGTRLLHVFRDVMERHMQ